MLSWTVSWEVFHAPHRTFLLCALQVKEGRAGQHARGVVAHSTSSRWRQVHPAPHTTHYSIIWRVSSSSSPLTTANQVLSLFSIHIILTAAVASLYRTLSFFLSFFLPSFLSFPLLFFYVLSVPWRTQTPHHIIYIYNIKNMWLPFSFIVFNPYYRYRL